MLGSDLIVLIATYWHHHNPVKGKIHGPSITLGGGGWRVHRLSWTSTLLYNIEFWVCRRHQLQTRESTSSTYLYYELIRRAVDVTRGYSFSICRVCCHYNSYVWNKLWQTQRKVYSIFSCPSIASKAKTTPHVKWHISPTTINLKITAAVQTKQSMNRRLHMVITNTYPRYITKLAVEPPSAKQHTPRLERGRM